MELDLQLRDFVAHISKKVSPVSKVLEVWGKCAEDKIAGKAVSKPCDYLSAALNERLNELKTVDVPEYFIEAFSKDAEFMKDFGDNFLYLDTLTRHFGRLCLSKLGLKDSIEEKTPVEIQLIQGTPIRVLVDHFQKNSTDVEILEHLFGQATLYGSEEPCDVLCWTKVYLILVADIGLLRGLSNECFEEFAKALKKGLVMDTGL